MDVTPTTSVSLYLEPSQPVSTAYPVGGAAVIAVSGDLRSAGFADLERLVTEALDHGHRHLVLDLQAVSSIEPQALGLLWAALRGVRRRGGVLTAAAARSPLRPALRALSSGGLSLYDTVEQATSAGREAQARA